VAYKYRTLHSSTAVAQGLRGQLKSQFLATETMHAPTHPRRLRAPTLQLKFARGRSMGRLNGPDERGRWADAAHGPTEAAARQRPQGKTGAGESSRPWRGAVGGGNLGLGRRPLGN
jgi:hypothetical protein